MYLPTTAENILFEAVPLHFTATNIRDIFALKRNRTVHETLLQPRYRSLEAHTLHHYMSFLNEPLGSFVLYLKRHQDAFYQQFLNPYGDSSFCTFALQDTARKAQKGLYAFFTDTHVQYIGRCRDSFGKRINQCYGHIHPKNCYRDGQATNCHLNALIAAHKNTVSFYVHPMTDDAAITRLEKELIRFHNPLWNIALRTTRRQEEDAQVPLSQQEKE